METPGPSRVLTAARTPAGAGQSGRIQASGLLGAQGVDQSLLVGRTLRAEGQRLVGHRVLERQPLGVQRLSAEAAQGRHQLGRGPLGQLQAAAVQRITDQRMVDMRHVHANLVGAAGFQAALDQAVRPETLAQAVMGDGALAVLLVAHGLAQAVAHVAADRGIYRAAGHQGAQHHRLVLPLHVVAGQHLHQRGMGRQALGHHHQARGVLVQAVHDAATRQLGQGRIVMQRGVQHGAGAISCARMHHQPGRLVQHQQVFVLVDDVQGDGLRLQLHFGLKFSLQQDFFPATEQLAGRRHGAVQGHRAGLDPCREARTGIIGEHLGQRLVEPATCGGQGDRGFVTDRRHDRTPGHPAVSAIIPFRSNI